MAGAAGQCDQGGGVDQAGRGPLTDTIVALSSGRPPAAIAIIRMSGPASFDLARTVAGSLPPPRRASLRALRDADGMVLDRALMLRFEAESSATGEDLVEFHCHGGLAVVRAVERALLDDRRARQAEPGEFTRRALENGRIDLAQARGLADLLEAETETQRRHAMAASEGHLSRLIEGWIDRLVSMAADIEASIDYDDDGDVAAQAATLAEVIDRRRALVAEIRAALAAPPVERWRDGIRIVLAGPPNSGKSTLLNRLVGRELAIVTSIPGTTRDRIDAPVQREGVAYIVSDTAGIRDDTGDPIEAIGIERARHAAASADLVLWLGDGKAPMEGAVHVHARADLPGRWPPPDDTDITVRADDPDSCGRLWELIATRTADLLSNGMAMHEIERADCRECVDILEHGFADHALIGESTRAAISTLGRILGIDATEAVLDRLFARFCVGK